MCITPHQSKLAVGDKGEVVSPPGLTIVVSYRSFAYLDQDGYCGYVVQMYVYFSSFCTVVR